ncbi:MAG TPA: hypothetical protein VJ963_13095 [Bacteroidales bacterium]|nr:hypothetical protein [Bacteroidales bacterium]
MKGKLLFISFFFTFSASLMGQDSIRFSGQASTWLNINPGNLLPLAGGVRYIPQVDYSRKAGKDRLFDAELSLNIYGSGNIHPFDTLNYRGNLKPYRGWLRYSTKQLEIRLGLQKLNFGSAMMLRPLMWFDQLDPRDPLQLTDGVYGLLARYYFLNNANIWVWSLYGNKGVRGWETIPVNTSIPEFGGRIQLPLEKGEVAFTYHHRIADSRGIGDRIPAYDRIPENKFGFDARWDLMAGLWLEGSYTNKRKNLGMFTNQLALDVGADYTFGLGNGLYIAWEQLLASYDEKPFTFTNKAVFSLLTMRYPVGIIDNISAIVYYDWSNRKSYNFLTWQRQYDRISLYLMAYMNPDTFLLPAQTGSENIFAGKGIQLMFVFNH